MTETLHDLASPVDLTSVTTTEQQRHAAAVTCAEQASGPGELALVLDMLGLSGTR